MIHYRMYSKNDRSSYIKFCKRNFGKNSYQSNLDFIDWLLKYNNNRFFIMLNDNTVVGCIHLFKGFFLYGENIIESGVIHDLMVDKNFRNSGGGLRLIQHGIKSNDFTILSGSVGKLSQAYKRMCPIQMKSYWYKKIMFPKSIFLNRKISNLDKYRKMADDNGFKILCNDTGDDFIKTHSFEKYNLNEQTKIFFHWRFLEKGAPKTFIISDFKNNNSVMFVFAKKGLIPYLRIFDIHKEEDTVILDILKLIEKIAVSTGITVVLYTVLNYNLVEHLGYKKYDPMPSSYIYVKNRKKIDQEIISMPGYCSDLGFDSKSLN